MTDTNTEYRKAACLNALSFFKGETSKEGFVNSYKKNASKSAAYAFMIEDLMQNGLYKRHERGSFANNAGLTKEECDNLFAEQIKASSTERLVGALFEIGYTRIPNNELGGDGRPASYNRKINTGAAAERALLSLSCIPEYSLEMSYLRTEYAFPRKGIDFKVKDSVILESVRQDYITCAQINQKMARQLKTNS